MFIMYAHSRVYLHSFNYRARHRTHLISSNESLFLSRSFSLPFSLFLSLRIFRIVQAVEKKRFPNEIIRRFREQACVDGMVFYKSFMILWKWLQTRFLVCVYSIYCVHMYVYVIGAEKLARANCLSIRTERKKKTIGCVQTQNTIELQ